MNKNFKQLNNSQKETISKKLISLSKNVCAADRKKCIEELKISVPTLSAYLHGTVRDIETGLGILLYFSNIIETREEMLAKIA